MLIELFQIISVHFLNKKHSLAKNLFNLEMLNFSILLMAVISTAIAFSKNSNMAEIKDQVKLE